MWSNDHNVTYKSAILSDPFFAKQTHGYQAKVILIPSFPSSLLEMPVTMTSICGPRETAYIFGLELCLRKPRVKNGS